MMSGRCVANAVDTTYHDVMRQALSEITTSAVPSECYRAEKHLRPSKDRIRLADHSMRQNGPRTDGHFVYVKFEVHAERKLEEDGYEEDVCHNAMDAREVSSAAVCVSENVSAKCQSNACALFIGWQVSC